MARQGSQMSADRVWVLPCCLLVFLISSACFRPQAKATPGLPPLVVPPPPPRVVEAPVETEARESLTEEPPPVPTAQDRPEPAQEEAGTSAPEPRETVAAPSRAGNAGADIPDAGTPPATLQVAPSRREVQLEREIRARLIAATTALNRVDYRQLGTDAKIQYDQARRFTSQARDALQAGNLLFAENLADKAATLAAQLAGR